MEEIIQYNEANLIDYVKKLHEEPPTNEVRQNAASNNTKYIPISFLEMKLDEVFDGCWSTRNFQTKIIANEICGELELEVFNLKLGIKITRIGAAAVIVRQKKDSALTDQNSKIKNALVMDYPHLKAECFRNACLSLGKKFGRDLNREFVDEYEDESIDTIRAKEDLNDLLKTYTDRKLFMQDMVKNRDAYIKRGLSKRYVEQVIKDKLKIIV